MTKPASPLAIMARASRRSLAFWLPVSHAVLIPSGSSQVMSLRKCCSAKISVGAISAHCQPASMHRLAASAATTVLPEPTSPCSRRCMGIFFCRSASISRPTRCCASVNLNGRRSSSCSCSVHCGPCMACCARGGARIAARTRRACNCDSCWASNSSAFRRCQAG